MNHGIVFKKIHKVIKFNQKTWLKSYIDMNAELRKKSKKWFWKIFLWTTNNSVFGKPIESVRKRRDSKLVTKE